MTMSKTFGLGFVGILGVQGLVAKLVLIYGEDIKSFVSVAAATGIAWGFAALQTWARNRAVVEGSLASPATGMKEPVEVR